MFSNVGRAGSVGRLRRTDQLLRGRSARAYLRPSCSPDRADARWLDRHYLGQEGMHLGVPSPGRSRAPTLQSAYGRRCRLGGWPRTGPLPQAVAWSHKSDQRYVRRMRLMDRRAREAGTPPSARQRAGRDERRAGPAGKPGVGKSALLDYAVERASDLQIVRTVAVESEMALGFAAVHQLLVPFLHCVDRLPEPQQRALAVAFGLVNGPPADPFLVGLAVLTLLSDTARVRPVLCVIDDAQWLDDEFADTLTFVARRLLADRVGMLLALRETTEPDPRLQALPGLRLAGLPEPDAYELLASAVGRPIEAGVAQRIVAETGGNPLAIVEVARELTPEQLRGQMPLPEPLPVGHQLEDLFVRRARELPTDTQTLLLLAAAEQPGRGDRLWQAAAALGIPESTAVPAEAAGLVVFGPEVRFSHPLVRSAVYHAAAPSQRRQAHRALAAAC